ncbi:low affinity immunoglobulin gamma Fc region receptor III-like [Amphiprion ocellaris]|uniref:low affinity immunoglobulin gamma Fc region receptor III-like n=1 Tax=Amphiprion ocellaris TaxID=80972 RepID=UPI002411008D|nr:low affinity immunoglobulin gamma Fc region receptor III-like [Amphiprion ocellaris]
MEVRALCITLMMILLPFGHKVDAASLHIKPNRLQFFEYESITFYCQVDSYEDITFQLKGKTPSCGSTTQRNQTESSCHLNNAYASDSGEYWCEAGGKRSNSINVIIKGRWNVSVVLESPALPVMEGEAVTLRCRNKVNSSLAADFYKDGLHVSSSSSGKMDIHRVSKSDEGLYKCSISGGVESAESRLTVRAHTQQEDHNDPTPPSSSATPWIIITVLLIILLVVGGLHHFAKDYWDRVLLYMSTIAARLRPADEQPVSEDPAAAEPTAQYATVTRNRKKKDEAASSSRQIYYTLGLADTQLQGPETSSVMIRSTPSSGTVQVPSEDSFYSTIR